MPATEITSIVGKRQFQNLRIHRKTCYPEREEIVQQFISKRAHYVKEDVLQERKVVVWNRDVDAGRNIMYRGEFCSTKSRSNLEFTDNESHQIPGLCMMRGEEPNLVFTAQRLLPAN